MSLGPLDDHVRLPRQLRGSLVGGDPDADGGAELAVVTSERSALNASRSVRSSPANRASSTPDRSSRRRTAVPLSMSASGLSSSTFLPHRGSSPVPPAPLGDLTCRVLRRSSRPPLLASAAPGSVPCPRAAARWRPALRRPRPSTNSPGARPPSAIAGSSAASSSPGIRSSRPWLPAYASSSTPTTRRASIARRPETQATSANRCASSRSAPRVSAGTVASAGSATIGASVPSTSNSAADSSGAPARARAASSGSRPGRRSPRLAGGPHQHAL